MTAASAAAGTVPAWIDLAGAANVRDVAGLPTVDGRTVRPGVLLRADNLQGLTGADVARLVDDLGVRTVVDLRTTGEVHLEGPGPLAGRLTHHHLTLIDEDPGEPDEVKVDRAVPTRVDRRPDEPRDMTGHYVGYVTDAPANVAAALRVIADPTSGPTLVHCAAGKDRTGTVVALALSLVGVTREAVVADYVASAERVDAILARLKASPTYAEELEGVTADDVRPRAESMERFLDAVNRDYGGPHGLATAIGVDEETAARLAARLVGTSR